MEITIQINSTRDCVQPPLATKQPNYKELCIKTKHFIGSQMYLKHCHPILNHDIALMMAINNYKR